VFLALNNNNRFLDKKHGETLKGVSSANTVLIFDEANNLVMREGHCLHRSSMF
jgi:hypothetical protein